MVTIQLSTRATVPKLQEGLQNGKVSTVKFTNNNNFHLQHHPNQNDAKDSNGKDKYTCDCDATHTVLTSLAGKMCEYASTSFCARCNEKVLRETAHALGTNGGTCVDIVTP